MRRAFRYLATIASVGLTAPAWAQGVTLEELRDATQMSNVTVEADIGIANYWGDLNDHTRTGPAWGISVSGDRGRWMGYEVAYEGSRNPIELNFAPSGAAIFRNGVSGMAKFGPDLYGVVRPYVGAGLGVAYVNPNELAEIRYRNDFMAEIPLAVGIEGHSGPLNAGIRATYRLLAGDEFADLAGAGRQEGALFSTTLNLGGRF